MRLEAPAAAGHREVADLFVFTGYRWRVATFKRTRADPIAFTDAGARSDVQAHPRGHVLTDQATPVKTKGAVATHARQPTPSGSQMPGRSSEARSERSLTVSAHRCADVRLRSAPAPTASP